MFLYNKNKMKKLQYNGNNLFGINFGLYQYEDIDFENSKERILNHFIEKYWDYIKLKMENIGIQLIKFEYFSPKAYNFSTDSIDAIIVIKDKNKLKNAILENKDNIQKLLDKNKSYDGYMALTVNTVEEELERLNKPNYEIDILVLKGCLEFELEFNITDWLVYDENDITSIYNW